MFFATQFSCKISLVDFAFVFEPWWGSLMRLVIFSRYEMSWDFVMRLHAFGSLCDFVMTLFSVLLDSCLMMRVDGFFCRYEISCWDFLLFVAHCILICVSPKSPSLNASKSLREWMLRTTSWDETWTRSGFSSWFSLVARWGCKGMGESEFGRRGGVMEYAEKGSDASWP